MYYKSKIYQINSLRLGLLDEGNLYGKLTIFFTCASQDSFTKQKVKKYIDLFDQKKTNLVALPYNHNGSEPGDDHDIYSYYENFLNISFYVAEKVESDHKFFLDFGIPTQNFTEYHFDKKNKFIGKYE